MEKSRRLQEIEDRLARRRLMHKREMTSNPTMSEEEKRNHDEDLKTAEVAAGVDIQNLKVHMDKLKEGIMSGFKKRSINELKAVKANNGLPLSVEDQRKCYQDAADALKKRHERDQKSLLDSLAAERSRQRIKIHQRLEAKKNKLCPSGEANTQQQLDQLQYLDEQALEAVRQMEHEFDKQQAATVQDSQREVLLALSVINLDAAILDQTNSRSVGDDDDSYLEDNDVGQTNMLTAWIQCAESASDAYLCAEGKLFQQMRHAMPIEAELTQDDDIETNIDGFNVISSHMSKVLTEAFCEHVSEFDARELSKRKSTDNKMDSNRIRAGIMNEFEKARDEYEEAMETARMKSKAKLEKRKGQEAKDSQQPVSSLKSQVYFEDVIDAFLDDPVSAVSREVPPRKIKPKAVRTPALPMLTVPISNRLSSSTIPIDIGTPLNSIVTVDPPLHSMQDTLTSSFADRAGSIDHANTADAMDKNRIRAAHEERERALVEHVDVVHSCR